jgi:hypothetical protein
MLGGCISETLYLMTLDGEDVGPVEPAGPAIAEVLSLQFSH